MISLHVEPGIVMTWEEFRATKPAYSIALDGYVYAPPAFTWRGPYANFDHHVGVSRLDTRSVCMQVYLALTLGLFDTFQREGQPYAQVYVNDADHDICLTYWLLTNPEKVEKLWATKPITGLLILEDILDATAGAYPIPPDRPIMRQQAWIFEPYSQARSDGALDRMGAEGMGRIIESVCQRISRFSEGKSGESDLDTRYERAGGGPGWQLISEIGLYARTKLYSEGYGAFVSFRDRQNGLYTYSIGKMSPFVRFPIPTIFERLNEAEGLRDPNDAWGGSATIGGSPRRSGSRLAPAEIEEIVNDCLDSTSEPSDFAF